MSIRINALILWSERPERVAAFYRLLGLPLADEDHGDGHVHQACDCGGLHVAVYGGGAGGRPPARRAAGSAMVGFVVPSLAAVTEALRAAGELRELVAPQQMDWGLRAVFEDPDGRAVELTEGA